MDIKIKTELNLYFGVLLIAVVVVVELSANISLAYGVKFSQLDIELTYYSLNAITMRIHITNDFPIFNSL